MPRKDNRIEDGGIQRAALYIRVSSEEQAIHGLSLASQHETLVNYASENNLRIVGIYTDEGITARKKYSNRTAFMTMLTAVQKDEIDLILFIKLDRWFRNVADYYEVQKILDAHNVRWIATEEDYDTTTANGRLHLNIKLSIAQDESDRTSERIKFVFKDKLRRGEVLSGATPVGYRIKDKHLVVDPETKELAKDIFEQYISVRSLKALRRCILEKHGQLYTERGLKMMLCNTRYMGLAYGQSDYCEAIVDKKTFSLVQTILSERAQRNADQSPRIYLFTGLVYCSECGSRLCSHTIQDKYVYYRCSRQERYHDCEHKKRTNEAHIEDWLLHNILTQLELYNLEIGQRAAKFRVKVDETKIKRKMDKLKDLYLNDLIDRESYEHDYIALRRELESATSIEEPPKPVDVHAVRNALNLYSNLTRQGKKEFWSRTISKIIVTNDNDFSVIPI